MQKPGLKSYILLLLLGAVWGSAFFNYKIVMLSFDFYFLAGGRLFFASLFLFLFFIFLSKKIKFKYFISKDAYHFILVGLMNYVCPFLLIAHGINNMSSGTGALLMSSGPFYAIIISHFFLKDHFNKVKFIGTFVGFLSILILVYDRVHLNQSTDFLSVLYVILASLSYVIGGAIIQKLKKYDIEHISLISMFYGTLILTPFIIYELFKLDLNSVDPTSIYSLIYLGVVSTAIAFLIRSRLIYQHGLIFMSQVSFLVPLFGVYFSWLFLNETLSINMIISLIITILGLYVLQKGYSKIKS